jgi:hypothetical protein
MYVNCLDSNVRFGSRGWRAGFGRELFFQSLRFRNFETFPKDALLVGVSLRMASLPQRWRVNGHGNVNNIPAITIAIAFLKISVMDLLEFNLNFMKLWVFMLEEHIFCEPCL